MDFKYLSEFACIDHTLFDTLSIREFGIDPVWQDLVDKGIPAIHPAPGYTGYPGFDHLVSRGGFNRGELVTIGAGFGHRTGKSDFFFKHRMQFAQERWERYARDARVWTNATPITIMCLDQVGHDTQRTTVRPWSQEVFHDQFSTTVKGRAVFRDGSPYVEDYSGFFPVDSMLQLYGGHWEQRYPAAIVPEGWYPDPKRVRAQLKALRAR